jgi:hypothetical protein
LLSFHKGYSRLTIIKISFLHTLSLKYSFYMPFSKQVYKILYKIGLWFLAISLLFFSLLMLKLTLPYLSFDTAISFLLTKQNVLHIQAWYYSFYIHITTSIFVLMAGLTQFSTTFLQKYRKIHRYIGKMYVGFILLLAAPSGLVMAVYANGGFPAKVSFVFTAILWWIFTFYAYFYIRKGNIQAHKAFMYRSYALTLSAISLRIYTYTFPALFQVRGKELYITVAWLSWTLNLLVAEWLIRKLKMENGKWKMES